MVEVDNTPIVLCKKCKRAVSGPKVLMMLTCSCKGPRLQDDN